MYDDTIIELRRRAQILLKAAAALEEAAAIPPEIPELPAKRRGRKFMGPAERAEVSRRMKRYWAGRRRAGRPAGE